MAEITMLAAITLALAREMLALAGLPNDGAADPAAAIADGRALAAWEAMIRAQGGDPDAPLPVAGTVEPLLAERDGVFAGWDAYPVGVAAWLLGAGRARKEDSVDPAAGIRLLVDPGEPVAAGQPLLELHTDRPDALDGARAALAGAARFTEDGPAVQQQRAPLVLAALGTRT